MRTFNNFSKWKLLKEDFFARNTVEVSKNLLGKYMYHESAEGITVGKVVETEAYLGKDDPACHSARGRTMRNEVMFGPAGYAYIYLIYGMHLCFNVTTDNRHTPAAVLLRALEPLSGLDLMRKRRSKENLKDLCSGPGKLVQAMGISLNENGKSVTLGPVRFFEGQDNPEELNIVTTTRVGISQAVDWPLRFYLKESPFVSRR